MLSNDLPKFKFSFPRTKFVTENGLVMQVAHMASEQSEVEAAMLTPDIDHTAEELMDKYHSNETALRILAEKHHIDLDELHTRVISKNERRGYYS
jgi:hypothetical protein